MTQLDQLDVFFGSLSSVSAAVYARLPHAAEWEGATLAGRVVGPECDLAGTLPAEIALCDAGPGETLLARASIPDPTFWTPNLPARYEVEVELRRGDRVLASATRWLGIRPLGAKGHSLYQEGQRWVPRGVCQAEVVAAESCDLDVWRESDAAMLVDRPDEKLCEAASRQGVLLVAGVRGALSEQAAEFARLARWPAVGLARIEAQDSAEFESFVPRSAAPNILPVQVPESSAEHLPASWAPAPWAEACFAAVEDRESVAALASRVALPLIAFRRLSQEVTVEEGRAACDRLQAELAPGGDYAGYFV